MNHSMKGPFFTMTATVILFASSLLSGCNTMQGAGKDVSAAGNAVQAESCEHNSTSTKDCSSTK